MPNTNTKNINMTGRTQKEMYPTITEADLEDIFQFIISKDSPAHCVVPIMLKEDWSFEKRAAALTVLTIPKQLEVLALAATLRQLKKEIKNGDE